MRGYSEHRKTINGRLELDRLHLVDANTEVGIYASESSKKDRGVDIRIFLSPDDIVQAVRLIAEDNPLVRLRLKAELANLDYEHALAEANSSADS